MSDSSENTYDAIIIGGGFYGVTIALYLKQRFGFRIKIIEQEAKLLARASYHNQARIHNGYHYPRSFTTAYRSRLNLPQFIRDWPQAVKSDFTKIYAIARSQSKVNVKQFQRFCHEIGASLKPAPKAIESLFDRRTIAEVFLVEEYAFNTEVLHHWACETLAENEIEIAYQQQVQSIHPFHEQREQLLKAEIMSLDANRCLIRDRARFVFNCTYSGLNQFNSDQTRIQTPLKHEITEMALLSLPSPLDELGITVMDGPFFSLMPFPARKLHTLSHVRYTPHTFWMDDPTINPYQKLRDYDKSSRVERMLRDSARYLPLLANAEYRDSLFEVKTVLMRNENDDGRPIFFQKHTDFPQMYSILGSKIDNIYDVLMAISQDPDLTSTSSHAIRKT